MFLSGYQDNTVHLYETYADCCSETWFSDIVGVANLFQQKIMAIEILEFGEVEDGRSRQEVDEAYGVKLKTTSGYVDIAYRNSSNGYYGGSVSLISKVPANVEWITIEEDYSV